MLSILGLLMGWLGFIEKRLKDMKFDLEQKLLDKQELNKLTQENLKEDMLRLEQKIDVVLSYILNSNQKK